MDVWILRPLYARKAGYQQAGRELIDSRNLDFLPVPVCTLAFCGCEHFPAHRLVDDSCDQFSRFLQADRNRKAGVAMREIRSPVEGVDMPAEWRIGFRASALLGNNGMCGKMRSQSGHDSFLGTAVRLGNDIDF